MAIFYEKSGNGKISKKKKKNREWKYVSIRGTQFFAKIDEYSMIFNEVTLKEEIFAGRNFREFREFWPNSRK